MDVALGADLVDEVCAGFEGELLGEDEGVVAVEEDGFDLERKRLAAAEVRREELVESEGESWLTSGILMKWLGIISRRGEERSRRKEEEEK